MMKNKEVNTGSLRINGIAASQGISIGRAYVLKKNSAVLSGVKLKDESAILAEIEKFDTAVQASVNEIESLRQKLETSDGDEAGILETQVELLTDPQIKTDVFAKITMTGKNANDALIEVTKEIVALFENMDDEYMRARSADVEDISSRILKNLNQSATAFEQFESDTILIADDITPSDTITMDVKHILGFATKAGGKTSHTAILARAKGIPAVLGCGHQLNVIRDNDVIIVDGNNGSIIINPADDILDAYKVKKEEHAEKTAVLSSLKNVTAKTSDGETIHLSANISNAEDIEGAFEYGAEGSGLFRTELLFMGRDSFPSEEEQFEFYKQVALKSRQKPVIVRTIDIGGDKQLPYFGLPDEENPFLGYRAIRICLDRKEIFIAQLKAILRAGLFGNFKIMFPMIGNIQELRSAKEILEEAKQELTDQQIAFAEKMEVGIMIEIPSAAITADILAKEVDFFSIGTNDLCQYTLAVDRMNEKIKDLYDPFHPAVLRLIKYVIEQAGKYKINVGMCGEMASDPMATLLLAGMGLKEFSMSAAAIPAIKNIIVNNSFSTAETICRKVMELENSQDVRAYLNERK